MMPMNKAPLLTLVGFGAGNGLGIARAFGAAGYRLALVSRTPAKSADALAQLSGAGIQAKAFAADAGDAASLNAAFAAIAADLGAPDVLVYNAMAPSFGRPSTLSAQSLVADFTVNVVGAFVSAQAVLPAMKQRGSGAILFTGGGWAMYPLVDAASASLGKAALRNLTFTLAEDLKGSGVRVGTLTIMGPVKAGTPFDPDKIGRAFLAYAQQPAAAFEPEQLFKGA
jgi:NAD(P)-dependent dehydrogenase (short-subunit alcohol dehydrogenase family)